MGPVGGQGLSLWGVAGEEVLAPPDGSQGPFFLWRGREVGGTEDGALCL